MGQLNYKTLRQEVADEIRKKILTGQMRSGERLKEQEIALMLGVSRGPVREALRQLEQEGLVRYERNVGCSVAVLNEKDIYEVGLLRAVLEVLAVRLCRGKVSPGALQKMRECVQQMHNAGDDLCMLAQLDNGFHACIVEEAGFPKLEHIWKSMDASNMAVFAAVEKSDVMRCAQRHQELLKAYETQREQEIVQALQKHYDLAYNVLQQGKGTKVQDDLFWPYMETTA